MCAGENDYFKKIRTKKIMFFSVDVGVNLAKYLFFRGIRGRLMVSLTDQLGNSNEKKNILSCKNLFICTTTINTHSK